jgi:hypothetical protein
MAAALTVFLASYSLSFAYRPFTTEDAGVAGKGVAQFEISWDYLKWRNGDRNNIFLFVPIYGLTDKIELSVEVPCIFSNPSDDDHVNGVGDVNLVGKFLLLAEKGLRPAFTLKGIVKTNSGDEKKGLGSGDIDYSIVAVSSKGINALTLHAMLGYTFVGDNGDENIRNIYLYGIAADYALTEKFHCVAEINGNQNPDRRITEHPVSSLLGITYKVSDMITLDGGVRYGFNDSLPQWNTTMGMTITF